MDLSNDIRPGHRALRGGLSYFARVMFIADLKTRDTSHPSEGDSYAHYTTVFRDKDGNHITTHQVYP